jgi:hypothetical protein
MVVGIGWLMKIVFLGSTLMSVFCNGGMSEESRGDVRNLGHYLYVSRATQAAQDRQLEVVNGVTYLELVALVESDLLK